MDEGEEFIGGFAGGLLARGILPGYGVYATIKRIIGVRLNMRTSVFGQLGKLYQV